VRTIALLSLILAMAGVAPPRGSVAGTQAPQQPAPRFRTGVDVVEVAVLVRDREGKPVTDLTRNEITVLENGAPQTLVAFEKVSFAVRPAEVPQRAVQVPLDVASNESLAPARVFVLVLDSHHVSATRARTVKALARQFVENNVGPDDFVGVFSPGALAAATQDFTTDKARLLRRRCAGPPAMSRSRNRRPASRCPRRVVAAARRSPPCPRQRRHGLAAWRLRSRRCSRALCHSPGCRFGFKP
jgi:hypothetical protein